MSQESKTLVPKHYEEEEDLKAQESNDSGGKEMEEKKQEIREENHLNEEEDSKAKDDPIKNESGEPSNNSCSKQMEEQQHPQENHSQEEHDEQDHLSLTLAEEETLWTGISDFMANRLTAPNLDEIQNIIRNTLNQDVSDYQCLKIIDILTKTCRMGRQTNRDLLSYGMVAEDLEGELSFNLMDALWQSVKDNAEGKEEKEDVEVEVGGDGDDVKETDESAGSCEAAVDGHDDSSDTSNSTEENKYYVYRRT